MSQDPYSNPYGSSPSNPPSDPYSTPSPSNPYDRPPSENPYVQGQQPDYGYASAPYVAPQAEPLPLGEAIGQLPQQYVKVLTRPGVRAFDEERGKAEWGIVWIQLLVYAIIAAIISYLSSLINPAATNVNTTGVSTEQTQALVASLTSAITLGLVPATIIGTFIGVGIIYLIAKMLGGQGSFLQQIYSYLLITVPIGIVTSLPNLIPVAGVFITGLLGSALGIYSIVLQVYSMMAVHRLSGGKATLAVLLPVILLLLLICGLIVLFFSILAAALSGAPR